MSQGIPYADIVILALIAGFILLRLRSVLGQRDDGDLSGPINREKAKPAEPVILLDEKSLKPKPRVETDPAAAAITDPSITDAIAAIKAKDPQFSLTEFLGGAKMAYEMVHEAFAKGDKTTLKMLLADGIYQDFAGEIDQREKTGQKTDTTLISVAAKSLTAASFEKNMARITVHFDTEIVVVERDAGGTIVGGSTSDIHELAHDWQFERDVTSKNPNWQIIET